MAFCDFVIKFNPEKDTAIDIGERIIYSLFINRIKAKKPAVTFISGDSGEGKSYTAIKLMEVLYTIQHIDPVKYMDISNIYTPLEYGTKVDKILNDKEYKKANVLIVHEGRVLIKANKWHSYLNQSVSDINALSRSVKPLINIVLSQFIRDIDPSVRYTITYYCKVSRPRNQPTRLYINKLWKDDRNLEKPVLRKRRLSGYLVYPNGKYKHYMPEYIELSKPSKELIDIFKQQDKESKQKIIKNRTDKLMKELQQDFNVESKKVETMVNWYLNNPEAFSKIGKQYKNKWRIKPDIREMHELTLNEAKDFETLINKKLKERGIKEDGESKRL